MAKTKTTKKTVSTAFLGTGVTERGGTLIMHPEGLGFVAWLPTSKGTMEVSWVPSNYPGLEVSIIATSDAELVKHVKTKLVGWHVRKMNLKGSEKIKIDKDDGEILG